MTMLQRVAVPFQGKEVELEYAWLAGERKEAPLIVFLHEGLGSAAVWGDWAATLCDSTGCRGLVYSRYGYGSSTRRPSGEPWPVEYLAREATEALPALLEKLGVDAARDNLILFGHSDGGSIALLYAAAFPGAVRATIAVAAHLFTDRLGIRRIRAMQHRYPNSALRDKLAGLHDFPDDVFWGWSELWLSDRFRDWNIEKAMPSIDCPVLAVQGIQDQYGTLEQLDAIAERIRHVTRVILDHCGHFPHTEQPDALRAEIQDFLAFQHGSLRLP
jgi:pimeloyl-ACP methyl ester carboxylesterase